MKIIFLDVDGVLNHRGSFEKGMPSGSKRIAPECVAVLNSIIDRTGASIVVSSTWRHDDNIFDILRDAGVRGEFIGKTPEFNRRKIKPGELYKPTLRGEEIQQWITDAEFDGPFVIVDDDNDMAHLLSKLVRTNFDAGLTQEHAELAVTLLGKVEGR